MAASSSTNITGKAISAEPHLTDAEAFDQRIAEAWKKCNLLTLGIVLQIFLCETVLRSRVDGGGIRGYWSLLALNKLMEFVADEEETSEHDDQRHDHSFVPHEWPSHVSHVWNEEERRRLDDLKAHEKEYVALDKQKRYLPCHYFDYIGGTSTGA